MKVVFFAFCVLLCPLGMTLEPTDETMLRLETILSIDSTMWQILDTTPIDSVVQTVKQETRMNYRVEFSIEKGADISYAATSRKPLSLPFSINGTNGRVYLRESLKGRVSFGILRKL
jgi:hypothetical protein